MKTKLLSLILFVSFVAPALGQEPPKTSIWSAASRGDVKLIQQHIEAGTDIDARRDDSKGYTPLYAAARKSKTDAVRVLLDAGADPNKTANSDYFSIKTRDDVTPLHYAVYIGNRITVSLLMKAGADPTLEDSDGNTPLDLVKRIKLPEVLPALVAHGLSENAMSKLGDRLMSLAIDSNSANAVRSLLRAGADSNGEHSSGEPLLIAAIKLKDLQVSTYLLLEGADPDTKNADGETALELAMAKKELKPLLRFFLDAGVDLSPLLNSFPVDHALVLASLAGDEVLVAALLKKGADPEYLMSSTDVISYGLVTVSPWSRTITPMLAAVHGGDADVLQQLLDAGVDAQAAQGQSTIGWCLQFNQPQLISVLLDAGADPESDHVVPWYRSTVVHAAAAGGHVEALENLIAAGADVNLEVTPQDNQPQLKVIPLHSAIQADQLETTRFLLENGADKEAKLVMSGGMGPAVLEVEPIILAVMSGNIEIVDLFIEHGVPLEGVQLPKHLQPRFSREFLEPLLERGAVVAETQLIHLVFQRGSKLKFDDPDDLRWYLDNGLLIDGANQQLETILHAAVKLALPLASFEVLVEGGADVNAINLQGMSPLDAALVRAEDERWEDGGDVVDYLEEAGAEESDLPSFTEAIEADNVEVLAFYLEQGLHPNYQITKGGGPAPIFSSEPLLVLALKNEAMGCAQLLVEKGADVNLRIRLWRNSSTPILLMVQAGNVSGVEFLLENGTKVDPDGPNQRAVASLNLNNQNIISENIEILELLIAAGADVNIPSNGRTLLSRLMNNGEGHADIALLLLENGAIGYGAKETLLAAINGHLELLEWLLENGVDPLDGDTYLNTPLHFAAISDYPDLAKRLINDDTLSALNAFGETPLDVATGETYDLLESHDAPDGHGVSFWNAIRDGNLDLVKVYKEAGMNLRVAEPRSEGNDRNLSPLLQAVDSKQSEIVLYLIEQHDDIFAEPNLMSEVRSKRLLEIEKLLKTKFRLRYRFWQLQQGNNRFSIEYGGFDYTAPYHLESSTDLKNWVKIQGTDHLFRNNHKRFFNLDFPRSPGIQQFIRLRKKED